MVLFKRCKEKKTLEREEVKIWNHEVQQQCLFGPLREQGPDWTRLSHTMRCLRTWQFWWCDKCGPDTLKEARGPDTEWCPRARGPDSSKWWGWCGWYCSPSSSGIFFSSHLPYLLLPNPTRVYAGLRKYSDMSCCACVSASWWYHGSRGVCGGGEV